MQKEITTLRNELSKIDNQISYLEDKQGFVPRSLKNQYWTLRDAIEKLEKAEEKTEK